MLSDKRYDELKKLFKEAVMESLAEEELTEGLNIKDCINFVKNLISKAKELGIKVDSDLEQEVNTTTESIELTEGFMDWLRSKKDKIFSLMLSIMVATNFPVVASAMEFKCFQEKRNFNTAVFELDSRYDLYSLLHKFGDMFSFSYCRHQKKDILTSKEIVINKNSDMISDVNRFIGYKLKIIDDNSDTINMYIYDRDNNCKLKFQVTREQLENKSLKDFIKNHNNTTVQNTLNNKLNDNSESFGSDTEFIGNTVHNLTVSSKYKNEFDDMINYRDNFWK